MIVHVLYIIGQEIYDLGGRKVAFQNAGPVGCLPSMKQAYNTALSDGCVEQIEGLIRLHNTALANVLKQLESQKPGFKYSVFDYYDAIVDRMHNPAKYGRRDGSDNNPTSSYILARHHAYTRTRLVD